MNLSCSVIIPCYNEEENVQNCIRRVPEMGKSTQIIVVDDGSEDKTLEKIFELKPQIANLKIIHYKPHRGKGAALKAGFDAADNDILIILDADMAVAPEILPQFFKPLNEGLADVVNGSRFLSAMEKGAMNIFRYSGNKLFLLVFFHFTGIKVTDTLCGTKALLKQDYLKMIWGKCPWGDFDILFNVKRLNLRLIETPVTYYKRIKGISKMKPLKAGFQFLRTCLRWRIFIRKEKTILKK